MPFYGFICKKCGHEYEIMSSFKKKEENTKKESCPECGSKSKKEKIAVPNFIFTNPVGTSKFEKSHDYRYKWNNERPGGVRDQRANAEKNSHMGSNPYNDLVSQDIEKDSNYGEVK